MSISTQDIAASERGLTDDHRADLDHLVAHLDRRGRDADRVIEAVRAFSVAAPSWAVG